MRRRFDASMGRPRMLVKTRPWSSHTSRGEARLALGETVGSQQGDELCGQAQHPVAIDFWWPDDVGAVWKAFEGLADGEDALVEVHRVPGQPGDFSGA